MKYVTTTVAFSSILLVTCGLMGCGKKGEECKALGETYNAAIKKVKASTKDLGAENEKNVKAMEAHHAALADFYKALEGKEPTTEELKEVWKGYRKAAVDGQAASNDMKATFAELDKIIKDSEKMKSGDDTKKKLESFQTMCGKSENDDDKKACQDFTAAMLEVTKAGKDKAKMGEAIKKLEGIEFKEPPMKNAARVAVSVMKAPMELMTKLEEAQKKADAAKKKFKDHGDQLQKVTDSLNTACGGK